jgi:hypothetical protein
MRLPRHLQGMRGKELAIGIVLTPLFAPLWLFWYVTTPLRRMWDWIVDRYIA